MQTFTNESLCAEDKEQLLYCESIRQKLLKEFFFDIVFLFIIGIIIAIITSIPIIVVLGCLPIAILQSLFLKNIEYECEFKKYCAPILLKNLNIKVLEHKAQKNI